MKQSNSPRVFPTKKQPAVKLVLEQPADAPEVVEEDQPKELTVVDSEDYQAIVNITPMEQVVSPMTF